MPRPSYSRTKILEYLYEQNTPVSVGDMIKKFNMPKETAYQGVGKLMAEGCLDVTINATDRIRKYELKENYRKWFEFGEQLGINVFKEL